MFESNKYLVYSEKYCVLIKKQPFDSNKQLIDLNKLCLNQTNSIFNTLGKNVWFGQRNKLVPIDLQKQHHIFFKRQF